MFILFGGPMIWTKMGGPRRSSGRLVPRASPNQAEHSCGFFYFLSLLILAVHLVIYILSNLPATSQFFHSLISPPSSHGSRNLHSRHLSLSLPPSSFLVPPPIFSLSSNLSQSPCLSRCLPLFLLLDNQIDNQTRLKASR